MARLDPVDLRGLPFLGSLADQVGRNGFPVAQRRQENRQRNQAGQLVTNERVGLVYNSRWLRRKKANS
jgi:hypothetical protein